MNVVGTQQCKSHVTLSTGRIEVLIIYHTKRALSVSNVPTILPITSLSFEKTVCKIKTR